MNQHSKTTIDMTGSKSANVDQPSPGPLPQQPEDGAPAPSTEPTAQQTSDGPKAAEAAPGSASEDAASRSEAMLRHGPIPPASEPLQYRAIGLIRGVYVPSEEQFTRGHIATEDGTEVDAVLLGRVMSLVKKHVDLAQANLWVVYPRTRPGNNDLHAQIVGIWDPENLSQDEDDLIKDDVESDAELDAADLGSAG